MSIDHERRLERIVGAFLVASALGVLALIAYSATGSRLFVAQNHYIVTIDDGTGLRPGLDVTVAGIEVGAVQAVRLNEDRQVELVLAVESAYAQFVKTDSVGSVSMTLTSKVVTIEGGSPEAPLLEDGGHLVSGGHFDLISVFEEMDLVGNLKRLEAILHDITILANQLHLGDGTLPELINDLVSIVDGLAQGQGSMGQALKDDTLLNDLKQTMSNVDQMAQDLSTTAKDLETSASAIDRATVSIDGMGTDIHAAVGHIEDASRSLEKTSGSVGQSSQAILGSISGLNSALQELGETMEAIQQLPLLRKRVEKNREGEPE